jgi:hypothetical protein
MVSIVMPFIARRRKLRKGFSSLSMSVPVGVLGVLFLLWGVSIVTSNYETAPVLSPDGRLAGRISVGPFGEQAVELFSWHGLRKEVVYRGDSTSMYWTDNSHLVIEYVESGDYGLDKSCVAARAAVVSCVQIHGL